MRLEALKALYSFLFPLYTKGCTLVHRLVTVFCRFLEGLFTLVHKKLTCSVYSHHLFHQFPMNKYLGHFQSLDIDLLIFFLKSWIRENINSLFMMKCRLFNQTMSGYTSLTKKGQESVGIKWKSCPLIHRLNSHEIWLWLHLLVLWPSQAPAAGSVAEANEAPEAVWAAYLWGRSPPFPHALCSP